MADTATTSETLKGKPTLPPVDPNINLPKEVRDAGKRAEIIQQSIVGQAEPSVLTPPQSEQTTPPPQGEPVPPPQDPPTPAAVPSEADVSPEEWRNRFFAMKGRFDRLSEQVGTMGDQVQRLQSENATLRSAPPPSPTMPLANLISEQELADYGPEFIDVVRRAATEVAAPLQEEIKNLRGQLGSVQQETGNAFLTRMHATIGGLIPNWQDLNRHPAFIQWVQLPDVFSGGIRQQLMQEAWNSGDAHRVAAFFRAFLAEEAAVDPRAGARAPQPSPASLAPGPPAAAPGVPLGTRLSLDQLAAPGRAQSSAQMPADKPMYTAQDISRFYTDCAAGKWRTREAERAAIDADIIAAQHEGRIIPDQRSIRPMDWNGNR